MHFRNQLDCWHYRALGVGIGLLLSDRVNKDQRRGVGLALLTIGVLTSIPMLAGYIGPRPFPNSRSIGGLKWGAERNAACILGIAHSGSKFQRRSSRDGKGLNSQSMHLVNAESTANRY